MYLDASLCNEFKNNNPSLLLSIKGNDTNKTKIIQNQDSQNV